MEESIKKMDEIINSLVTWLNDYPNKVLTKNQKVRIEGILQRMKNSQAITKDELVKFKSNEYKRIKNLELKPFKKRAVKAEKKSPISINSFVCDGCEKTIPLAHKENHRRKCKMWNAIHRTQNITIVPASHAKSNGFTNEIPGKSYPDTGNELKNQSLAKRKNDGSRYAYQIREEGKYGSYPSFEDYGEESNP